MAGEGVIPALALRSSVGIELLVSSGRKQPYEYKDNLPREETKNSRSIAFSTEGQYFAYSNGQEIKVLRTQDWQIKCTLPRPKAFYLKFSPRGNFLCTWELYAITKDKPQGAPNMYVYDLSNGAEVLAVVQKSQSDWEPSWSSDEKIFAMVVGGEALFYDLGGEEGVAAGFKSTSRRIGGSRGGMVSVGPGNNPFIAFYTPGSKGAPSMCKLYKYPALSQNQTVACKSFFQADRVEMLWNNRGTGLLLLTSTEVDKSGASYYGNQALHFMATKGDTCSVPLSKEGPVHAVKWSPLGNEFVVVFGLVPSKASLYNLKCDVVFDFGEGSRNCAYFNPFGNLLALAGFGNLPGSVEIWDVKKREQIASLKCPDTTHFDWSPNGEDFLAATTAPRLRISNGFKVYHYSGALMHETIFPQGRELYNVEWQQFADGSFVEPVITKAKQEGIKSSKPDTSKGVYTPPHLRCMREGKDPEKYVPKMTETTGLPTNRRGSKQNNQQKQQNKSNNKNKKTNSSATESSDANNETGGNGGNNETREKPNREQRRPSTNNSKYAFKKTANHSPTAAANINDETALNQNSGAADNGLNGSDAADQQQATKKPQVSEKERKIRAYAKKLADIKKLKARQAQGETLELNQLGKIEQEKKFLEELKTLKLSAA